MERINSLMQTHNVKIGEIEKAIDVGNGTVRAWAKAEEPNPQLDKLVKIANLFNTTVAYLIGETDSPESGKLIVSDETHIWDYLLPLTRDECQWIAVKRFVESHADHPLDDEEVERGVNELLS